MGFGVWGLGFGVWGLGFGVWGLGFGVWGLGFSLEPLLEIPLFACLQDMYTYMSTVYITDYSCVLYLYLYVYGLV